MAITTHIRMVALAAGFALTAAAVAQQRPVDTRPSAKPLVAQTDRAQPVDTDALRTRLESRLRDLQEEQNRVQSVLKRIEAGASPEELRRELASLMRRDTPESDRRDTDFRRDHAEGDARFDRRGDASRDRARLIEAIRERNPEIVARYKELAQTDPQAAEKFLREAAPAMKRMMDWRDENPQLAERRRESFANARQLMTTAKQLAQAMTRDDADANEVGRLRDELRSLVSQQVDLHLQAQKVELEAMRTRIAEHEAHLEASIANRDELVDEKFDNLMDRLFNHMEMQSKRPQQQRHAGDRAPQRREKPDRRD